LKKFERGLDAELPGEFTQSIGLETGVIPETGVTRPPIGQVNNCHNQFQRAHLEQKARENPGNKENGTGGRIPY